MRIAIQLIIIAALLGGGVWAWQNPDKIPFISEPDQKRKSRKGGRAVAVLATQPIQKDLVREVSAVGTLIAAESVDIASKVPGKIEKISFTEGAFVEKGTVLFTLDATEPKAELAESRAELVNQRKLYERAERLYKSKNVPKAQLDLLLAEMQISEAKVSADKARLNEYTVRAPFSGVLGLREFSVGALIQPTDIVTTLDDITSLKLDFDLPESSYSAIGSGQSFTAASVAYPDKNFSGKVQTISNRIDPVSRTVRVRGVIPNDRGALKPGMFLSVRLRTGIEADALLVPEHTLTATLSGHYLFVVTEEKVRRTPVAIGQRLEGWTQIVSGLESDAIIITEGVQKLKDGQTVKLTMEDVPFGRAPQETQVQ